MNELKSLHSSKKNFNSLNKNQSTSSLHKNSNPLYNSCKIKSSKAYFKLFFKTSRNCLTCWLRLTLLIYFYSYSYSSSSNFLNKCRIFENRKLRCYQCSQLSKEKIRERIASVFIWFRSENQRRLCWIHEPDSAHQSQGCQRIPGSWEL